MIKAGTLDTSRSKCPSAGRKASARRHDTNHARGWWNFAWNESDCSPGSSCGTVSAVPDWSHRDWDARGNYSGGVGAPGWVPVPARKWNDWTNWRFAIKPDADGYGALWSLRVKGRARGPQHLETVVRIDTHPRHRLPDLVSTRR